MKTKFSPMSLIRNILVIFLCLSSSVFAQTTSQKASVLIGASVSDSPPRITLSWLPFSGSTGYEIHRKLKNSTSWSQLGTTTGTGYIDNNINVGTYYEYKIIRNTTNYGLGYGYISAGVKVPEVDFRGKMILMIDNSFTSSLSTQISQLIVDLRSDGWVVIRHDISRYDTPTAIRSIIQSDYNDDPTNVKAVFLFGHVPVPYSGNTNPDGHGDHQGAWPADGYYGEMNGTWTDNSVNNNSASSARNKNIPGDGKFDQSDYPSSLELQVGRVDLYNMESFQYYAGMNEQTLLSNYLTKLHNFKTKQFTPQFRGCVFDNFTDPVMGPSASSGYRSVSANVGPENMQDLNGSGAPFSTYVNNQSWLWTYACGGGGWTLASNVCSTGEYAQNVVMGGVFNICVGSYFGDWDNMNNFLRAPLCSGKALTNAWSGWPNMWFHHMGMGDNIGYSTLMSMNDPASVYWPQNGGWHGNSLSRVHMGLMGDPSLRQVMVNMPSNLSIVNNNGQSSFSWTGSSPSPLGYNIYDLGDGTSIPIKLNTSLISGTNWSPTSVPFVPNRQYMVRSVNLEVGSTGSYYNMSLGSISTSSNISPILISIKVILEGPYNQSINTMRDNLKLLSNFPLSDPYPGLGYVHTGNGSGTIQQSILSVQGNNSIVDWVIVEIRSSSIPYQIVSSKSVLLQRDGDIVDRDGTSPVSFYVVPGNYRISVKHRNHLGIMTNNNVSLTNSSTFINLSSPSVSTYGTESRKQIGPIMAMIAGDATSNGQIKYTGSGNDRDAILSGVGGSTPNNYIQTYSSLDCNMDGIVRFTGSNNDRDIILINVGSTSPNNVKYQQIP